MNDEFRQMIIIFINLKQKQNEDKLMINQYAHKKTHAYIYMNVYDKRIASSVILPL